MATRSLTKLAVTIGGLALALTAGAGTASADPDFGPMLNTTCTYDQAYAALRAQNPMFAAYLDQSPPNQEFLRTYVASTPDQRANMLRTVQHNPGAQQAFPIFQQMFTTCNGF
jgi:hemophore-related protein